MLRACDELKEQAKGGRPGPMPSRAQVVARSAPTSPPSTWLGRPCVSKAVLQQQGLWSQYLEVGIGPDTEVFSKAPVLSSVGTGADIGVRSDSAGTTLA